MDTTYFRLLNLSLAQGRWFTAVDVERAAPVAIIGHGVRTRFFTTEEPLGRPIKVGDTWLTVIGVLEDRQVSEEVAGRLGIRDANMDVYTPLTTAHWRRGRRSRRRACATTRSACDSSPSSP